MPTACLGLGESGNFVAILAVLVSSLEDAAAQHPTWTGKCRQLSARGDAAAPGPLRWTTWGGALRWPCISPSGLLLVIKG